MPTRRRKGEICYLGNCRGNAARELGDQIDRGEITHAVMLFQNKAGRLKYRLIGRDDMTYLIGMMVRAMTDMHCTDQYLMRDRGPDA